MPIVVGNIITDIANIIAITPDALIFIGICVDCPLNVFPPTAFPAYWTGILLSAKFAITTATNKAIPTAPNITIWTILISNLKSLITVSGNLEIIFTNIIKKLHFQFLFQLFYHLIHIKNVDAVVNVNIIINTLNFQLSPVMLQHF